MEEKEFIKYLNAIQQIEMSVIPSDEQLRKKYFFSQNFEKNIDKIIQRNRKKASVCKFVKYIIAAAAIILIMMCLYHPQYIARARDIFIEWFKDHVSIQFMNDSFESDSSIKYKLQYIPEGFNKKYDTYDEQVGGEINYIKEDSDQYLYFSYSYSKSSVIYHFDNENSSMEESTDKNGNQVFIFTNKDNSHSLLWEDTDTGTSFLLDGYLNKNEILKVKDNIIEIK